MTTPDSPAPAPESTRTDDRRSGAHSPFWLLGGFVVGIALLSSLPVRGAPLLDPWPSAPTPHRGYTVSTVDERTTRVHTVALPSADDALEDDEPAETLDHNASERVPAWLHADPCSAAEPGGAPLDHAAAAGCRQARADAETQRRARARRQALLPAMRSLRDELGSPDAPIERPCRVARDDGTCQTRALDASFETLLEVASQRRQEPFRMTFWGDSLVAGDFFTGEVRALLQAQFGDGGHGFVHPGVPDRQVGALGMNIAYSGDWNVRTIVRHSAHDPLFGLAGVAFDPQEGPSVRIAAQSSERPIQRIGILMFRRAPQSSLRVQTPSGAVIHTVGGEPRTSHVEWITFDEPVAWVRLSAFSPGDRYFAILQDNPGPGAVVDNLGLVSSREHRLVRIDADHWTSQVEARGTDLLTFFYGANVAGEHPLAGAAKERYRDEYREVLDRARAMDDRDCLVVSVLTRGQRRDGGLHVMPSIPGLNAAQRQAAQLSGCGFWSAYEAIGAERSAARWNTARPQLLGADLSHPTRAGYRELGRLFYQAWIAAFVEWLEEA